MRKRLCSQPRTGPRTRQLLRMSGGAPVRLQAADRVFLSDLARVGIIDAGTASHAHYGHLKNGASRSLLRLERAGLITTAWVRTQQSRFQVWSFASREMAQAWGGVLPVMGATRSVFHEWLVAKLYFELGCPADYRVASAFSSIDIKLCGSMRPDAMYTSGEGEVVFVEADSGHYTRAQIRAKMSRWQGMKQIWGQPVNASAPIPQLANIAVIRV